MNSPQTTCPISEFHDHAAEFVTQVSTNQGPLRITESGNTVAVLLSMEEYQSLMDKIEILSDIALSEAEIAAGGGVEQKEFYKELKENFFP
ncbi:MAG: type II toxin-antitoxin system Phd/YefM family antitoxin [Fibrobacterota bacterium]|nr:MAG: type II toxin-antitoxin system Phd/YefM family antitoxin [Fibrobacterota bacterium]